MAKHRPSRGEYANEAYDATLDEPPRYEEANRMVRPSVVSAFGHDTLDRMPNINFYRNAGSVSGHRAVRPSLQELHDVFLKVSQPAHVKQVNCNNSKNLICLSDLVFWVK